MSLEFTSRLIGMLVFAFVFARLGGSVAASLNVNELGVSFIFSLVGLLFGLILTPLLTVRPIKAMRRQIKELSIELVVMLLVGTVIGGLIGLLFTTPLATLQQPLGSIAPTLMLALIIYIVWVVFYTRAREILAFLDVWFNIKPRRTGSLGGEERLLLLDTSVLIDGRIVEIAQSGFLGGTLLVPRFVISELHQVADSNDAQRRNRGRRGLSKLNEIQRESEAPFKIIEDDVEGVPAVDDKLIALALRINAAIVTIDYPLNQVAAAQGATVLNINELANAVRSAYIPGETFAIRVIQDGTEPGQGVGYLEDGTMVIIKDGTNFMDRTIYVLVTKLITRPTGRIIFAEPTDNP